MSEIKSKSEYNDLDKYECSEYIVYYKKGTDLYHNPYGPAIICKNGAEFYFIDGKCHRSDGPARTWLNGQVEYYIDNKYLTKEEFDLIETLRYLGKEYLISLR